MLNNLIATNNSKGKIFVVSAPAGTGKTTVVNALKLKYANDIQQTVSCTTRSPREGEVDGIDYNFISHAEFERKLKDDAFLEHVELFGNYYGTLKSEIERIVNLNCHAFLVIDIEGACRLKTHLDAVYLFLAPPSLEELSERLHKRGTETIDVINKRLAHAEKELLFASHYDYYIINDILEQTIEVIESIIVAEKHST